MANAGIINDYTIKPKSIAEYKARRGIMDFTQLGAFDQYESGYSFLCVLQMPKFMEALAEQDINDVSPGASSTNSNGDVFSSRIKEMNNAFKYMLEYEFRGLSGLTDVTVNTMTLTDGANEAQLINDVVKDTSVSVSMNFFERRGSLITKFTEYYLTGIKDPYSKAKTYHGLIANDKMEPSLANEVFTLLYLVTDNTMLSLEKAVLLCNCQLTKAETSIYDSERGQIGNKELSIEFNCLPITGYEVDKAGSKILKTITGTDSRYDSTLSRQLYNFNQANFDKNNIMPAQLDSAGYTFGIMDPIADQFNQATGGKQAHAIEPFASGIPD